MPGQSEAPKRILDGVWSAIPGLIKMMSTILFSVHGAIQTGARCERDTTRQEACVLLAGGVAVSRSKRAKETSEQILVYCMYCTYILHTL